MCGVDSAVCSFVTWYSMNCMFADGSLMLIVLVFLPGVAGGLMRGLIGITKHCSRGKESFKPRKLLFSLLTATLVGAVASVATSGDWRVAFLAGFAGSDVLDSLRKTRLFGLLT